VGTVVVVAALVVAALPGVVKQPFLDWHSWNPLAKPGPQVSVQYVWNETYAPLHWPKKITTMFVVKAPKPMYWPVARLETFRSNRWVLDERPLFAPVSPGTTLRVPFYQLPAGAIHHRTAATVNGIQVQVQGLADPHLVGAGQPLSWTPPSNVKASLESDGSALADHDLSRGAVYTMRAYVADPSVTTLENASRKFPKTIASGVVVNGQRIPLWPHRPPAKILLSPWLVKASNQVWKASGASSAHTEWDATAAVESYLRRKPFTYSQTTVYTGSIPVLAQFMLTKHKGYCQMFSGAMALVLRLHGIPARVAVGFTTGNESATSGAFIVTDRDAHAWVETYFPGWGWQPFDPTPTRHLPSDSSTSNPVTFAHLKNEVDSGRVPASSLPSLKKIIGGAGPAGVTHGRGAQSGKGAGGLNKNAPAKPKPWRPGFFTAIFLLAALVAMLTALAKIAAVRWRYLRRGPRAQAAAAYHELSTFLGDQGVPPQSSRTFEELARELDRVYGVDGVGFAQAASRARYGPDRGARSAEHDMRRELRGVKRNLRRQLTWRERATGAVRLRATLSQTTSMD
jgi:hypothetical protein